MIKDAKVINKQGCKHQNKWISRNTGTKIEQMNGKKNIKKIKKKRHKIFISNLLVWAIHKIPLPRRKNVKGYRSWSVSHICSDPDCVEPTHVIVELHADNMRRIKCVRLKYCKCHHGGRICIITTN